MPVFCGILASRRTSVHLTLRTTGTIPSCKTLVPIAAADISNDNFRLDKEFSFSKTSGILVDKIPVYVSTIQQIYSKVISNFSSDIFLPRDAGQIDYRNCSTQEVAHLDREGFKKVRPTIIVGYLRLV